jgi:hypothetical protein
VRLRGHQKRRCRATELHRLSGALLEAKGLTLGSDGSSRGKGGRKLSYVATVQGNGNLRVGQAHTAMLDLVPGDAFEIKLGRKQIQLIPAASADDDSAAAA